MLTVPIPATQLAATATLSALAWFCGPPASNALLQIHPAMPSTLPYTKHPMKPSSCASYCMAFTCFHHWRHPYTVTTMPRPSSQKTTYGTLKWNTSMSNIIIYTTKYLMAKSPLPISNPLTILPTSSPSLLGNLTSCNSVSILAYAPPLMEYLNLRPLHNTPPHAWRGVFLSFLSLFSFLHALIVSFLLTRHWTNPYFSYLHPLTSHFIFCIHPHILHILSATLTLRRSVELCLMTSWDVSLVSHGTRDPNLFTRLKLNNPPQLILIITTEG